MTNKFIMISAICIALATLTSCEKDDFSPVTSGTEEYKVFECLPDTTGIGYDHRYVVHCRDNGKHQNADKKKVSVTQRFIFYTDKQFKTGDDVTGKVDKGPGGQDSTSALDPLFEVIE